MSTTLKSSSSRRSPTEVFRNIGATMGLQDEKLVTLAIAEAALSEIEGNRLFALRVRALYDAYTATYRVANRSSATRSNQKTDNERSLGTNKQELVPIRIMEDDYRPDPAGPPNIQRLVSVFGVHQLAQALEGISKSRLQAAVEVLERQYPEVRMKGKSKATISGFINFLVAEAEKGHV